MASSSSKKHAAYRESEPVRVTKLYDEMKTFWRTGKTIKILIFEHRPPGLLTNKASCIEVIAFNPETCEEAPRLYLSSRKMIEKENEAKIGDDSKHGRELISKFIFNRINIVPPVEKDDEHLYVGLIPLLSDGAVGGPDDDYKYDGDKPLGHLPTLEHSAKNELFKTEFMKLLEKFEEEKKISSAANDKAKSLASVASDQIQSIHQRRRWGRAIGKVKSVITVGNLITADSKAKTREDNQLAAETANESNADDEISEKIDEKNSGGYVLPSFLKIRSSVTEKKNRSSSSLLRASSNLPKLVSPSSSGTNATSPTEVLKSSRGPMNTSILSLDSDNEYMKKTQRTRSMLSSSMPSNSTDSADEVSSQKSNLSNINTNLPNETPRSGPSPPTGQVNGLVSSGSRLTPVSLKKAQRSRSLLNSQMSSDSTDSASTGMISIPKASILAAEKVRNSYPASLPHDSAETSTGKKKPQRAKSMMPSNALLQREESASLDSADNEVTVIKKTTRKRPTSFMVASKTDYAKADFDGGFRHLTGIQEALEKLESEPNTRPSTVANSTATSLIVTANNENITAVNEVHSNNMEKISEMDLAILEAVKATEKA